MLALLVPLLGDAFLRTAVARDSVVAADGSGDFRTVQEAIDAVPANRTQPFTITLKPGIYRERVLIGKDKPFVHLRGEDAHTTVITWHWNANTPGHDGNRVGTSGSRSVCVQADDFLAENLTFENTAGDTGQAVALLADGDRQVYRNCRFLGWQDTLYAAHGRQYFLDCYVEGRVDFIFGAATAVFDRCVIHSKNGGYVTAASTPQHHPFGFVFLDCKLTGSPDAFDPATTNPATTQQARPSGGKTWLGRPWRPFGSVTFLRCDMGDHVHPAGWDNWRKPENEKTTRFAEHANTGPGSNLSQRVPWAKVLTQEEADRITVQTVLGRADGWDPTIAVAPPTDRPR